MMHKQLVEQTGSSDKVLDYGLLDSALETPFQTFDGKELYPTIQEKGARQWAVRLYAPPTLMLSIKQYYYKTLPHSLSLHP